MGPSGWRLAALSTVQHPHCCTTLITKAKRLLHERLRLLLRKEISRHTARLEALRAQGRIGRVIKSTLQEDSELFTQEWLCITGEGTLTDHRAIHNLVTAHFTTWYQASVGVDDTWPARIQDPVAFYAHTAAQDIPPDLSHLLWRALTATPGLEQFYVDSHMNSPPHRLWGNSLSFFFLRNRLWVNYVKTYVSTKHHNQCRQTANANNAM